VAELSKAELNAMIAEAIVDAHDEDEQVSGFYDILEEELAVPFETTVLGFAVTVEGIGLSRQAGSRRLVSAASTGRRLPSSTCRCRHPVRLARNGSPPTGTGRACHERVPDHEVLPVDRH
jgi:Calcium binding